MTSHTPAPTTAEERQQYLEYGAKHTPSDLPQDMETMWAAWNVRLTTQFDELLEALHGLMDVAELAMPDSYFQSDSRVVAARAAITKAEGSRNGA